MGFVDVIRPPLPNLVIHKILQILHTKAAVRMSFLSKEWDGVWCSVPVFDFDEGEEPGKYDNDQIDLNKIHDHRTFINVVERWMNYREKEQQEQVLLDKFRHCMMRYVPGDQSMIDKLLTCVFERRGVKELNLCLKLSRLFWGISGENRLALYYCITWRNLVNAESLTVLKLEHVRIKYVRNYKKPSDASLLPNLKTMSLRNVNFDHHGLWLFLMWECPSIEYLSLASCSFKNQMSLDISSSSLKALEVEHCMAQIITIHEAPNLESFTFSSESVLLWSVVLTGCINLKYIKVHAEYLKILDKLGSHDSLNATINTPNLTSLTFQGYLRFKLDLKAPSLFYAHIRLLELLDGELYDYLNEPWKHFLILNKFLEKVCSVPGIAIYVRDFKDITFPEDFRKKFPSPLHGVQELIVGMPPTAMQAAKNNSDLNDSLKWLAPFATDIQMFHLIYNLGCNRKI